MKIEPGKHYRLRDGSRARIYVTDGEGSFPVHGYVSNQGFRSWYGDGQFSVDEEHHCDIISEWTGKPAYPWDLIPPWFKWAAFDKDETCWMYMDKPEIEPLSWIAEMDIMQIPPEYAPKLTCAWQDSLAQRPEGK